MTPESNSNRCCFRMTFFLTNHNDPSKNHALHLYIFLFACIISIGRFHAEAAAGESHGQIYLNNMFLKAYFEEPAATFFRAEGGSPGAFRCLFEVFSVRGGTPETSGKTLGNLGGLKVSFCSHFGMKK